ncbi:hypothetical protein H4R19_000434 [Coemansia spiralis]|nr:hypothetical protein H4R19_000434 [Coemansia spiralis]
MDGADNLPMAAAPVSLEQLRAAFANGSPTVVHDALVPFLCQESRSNGDMRVINEIAESVSKLLYPWLQTGGGGGSQRSLYALLRPDGRLVDTLMQYYNLQRQHSGAAMTLPLLSLPVEYHALRGSDIGRAMGLPEVFVRRLVAGGSDPATAGFAVDALEYFLYHLCRALVPPRGALAPVSPSAGSARHGGSGSVAHLLAREYIGFFMPVAVPEGFAADCSEPATERSPIKNIRERLHDLSPRKGQTAAPGDRDNARQPGTAVADILDSCDYTQSLGLASFFASCAALLWLPAVPADVLAGARAALQSAGRSSSMRSALRGESDSAANWVWIPDPSQLPALHLFHMLVGHLARGERQMERYHLMGPSAAAAAHSGDHGAAAGQALAAREVEAYDKRIGMNGTIRDTLRAHCLNTAVADTLGLVLGSCGQAGFLDSDIWIPFVDVTTSIWLRYAMPWRGSRTEPAHDGSTADIPPLWRSRVPLMMKGLPPVFYGPALAMFLRQMSAPNVDLLVHTTAASRGLAGGERGGHGVQTWIHDAVSSVFGHPLTMDVLSVIERVVSAFAAADLRAILAAAERYQLQAFPRRRDPTAPSPSLQFGTPIMGMAGRGVLETPTKPGPAARQPETSADDARFDQRIAAAEHLIAPYAQEVVSLRSGSAVLDAALAGVLGWPPVCAVFGHEPSALLRRVVQALHGAEVLAERQLRLIVPEGSADQARSVVSDIFLVLSRLFSATSDDEPGASWAWAGQGGVGATQAGGTGETMRARAQSLHEAQARIRTLYARLATVFCATRRDIEALTMSQADAMISAASAGGDGSRALQFGASSSFGERLAARQSQGDWSGTSSSSVGAPDMDHGSLTPRGRWELKTGRKKFTTQSLLGSPSRGLQSPPPPPAWGLQTRDTAGPDETLLPRGPRAQYEARSYESQWLLDRVLVFNVWANRHFQLLLGCIGAYVCPVPAPIRAYKLDFRWAAAPQNIRFALLVLLALRLVAWLLF